jgi:hypothetical protein
MKRERDQMPDPDQPLEVPPRPPDDEGDLPDPDEDLTDEDAEHTAERSLSNELGAFGSGRSG